MSTRPGVQQLRGRSSQQLKLLALRVRSPSPQFFPVRSQSRPPFQVWRHHRRRPLVETRRSQWTRLLRLMCLPLLRFRLHLMCHPPLRFRPLSMLLRRPQLSCRPVQSPLLLPPAHLPARVHRLPVMTTTNMTNTAKNLPRNIIVPQRTRLAVTTTPIDVSSLMISNFKRKKYPPSFHMHALWNFLLSFFALPLPSIESRVTRCHASASLIIIIIAYLAYA